MTRKHDTGKLRWDLLPWGEVEQIVKVLNYGLEKYGKEDSWQEVERGESRYFAACMRHLVLWSKGEYLDSESGLPHLAHAACNILFLLWHGRESKK